MKFLFCAAAILFVLGASATPAEDDARLKIKGSFKIAEGVVDKLTEGLQNELKDHWMLGLKPLVHSIDQECVFEKYKKFGLFDELMPEEEVITKAKELIADPTKDKRLTRLAIIGVTCSSKMTPVLKLIFGALATTAEFAYEFREIIPFNEYFNQLVCYAHYAIGHNTTNPAQHGNFKPSALVNQTQEECYQLIESYLPTAKMIIDSQVPLNDPIDAAHRECISNELLGFAKKVLFTVNVLLRADMPESEKASERQLFFGDFNNAVENIVFCESLVKNKALE